MKVAVLKYLTLDTRWETSALGGGLTTSNVNIPGPARALGAENVNVGSGGRDGTVNVGESDTSDGNTGGWLSSWGTVLVILLDDNTVLGNTGEGDVLVGNAGDGSSGTGNSLDADTVGGVLDGGGFNDNIRDNVVGTSTDGSDGETVTTGAGSTGEGDAGTGVDSETVILVLNVGAGDGDISGRSNIESISVVSEGVTGRVVDSDTRESKTRGRVDGENLDWGVQDLDVVDGGLALQGVSVEELWLGLSTVGTLAIPVLGSVTIENASGGTGNSDVSSGDGDERTGPLFVTEGGSTLEDNVGTRFEASQVEGGSGWNGDGADDDGCAGSLGLDGSSGTAGSGEGAGTGPLLDCCKSIGNVWCSSWCWCWSGRHSCAQRKEAQGRGKNVNHIG